MDASVALRWIYENPTGTYASQVRSRMLSGSRALVPALWHLEVANGLWVAERRGVLSAFEIEQSISEIESMLPHLDTEAPFVTVRQALATARPHKVTAYDAVYLDAAGRHQLPLATLDEKLRAAAAKTGVALFR